MISKDDFKEKYEKIHEHFSFKDFLGLSALIFGLLLSNPSIKKTTANAAEEPVEEIKIEAPVIKKSKKVSKKKIIRNTKKKQRVTAARKK